TEWVRRVVWGDDLYALVHAALYRDPEAMVRLAQEMNRLLPPDQQVDPEALLPLHHLMLYMYPWLLPGAFLRELECVSLLRGETTGRACLFSGHTHVPQFWYLDGEEEGVAQAVRRRVVYEEPYVLPDRPALVNPGSVGQPRDGDPRAAYALLDCEAGAVTFYRVPYPVEKTKRDMARGRYPGFLQQRLTHAFRPDDWPPGFEL
ncbi:MAG: metallophosphoesterase family protein, partial [Candidatus Caldarchaeum sp.]